MLSALVALASEVVAIPTTKVGNPAVKAAVTALIGARAWRGGSELPSEGQHELLEVPPTASFEDIRRANRRIRDIYGTDSIAISGLYDPASLEAVHRRLDLAYTTLMDAAKRKEYDAELFPDGVPMPVQAGVGLIASSLERWLSTPLTTRTLRQARHLRFPRPPMPRRPRDGRRTRPIRW